jgi:hypothetical protein
MTPLYGTPKVAGRNVTERVDKPPDLDPDIAMWPVTPLSRWPFIGSPAEGVWPVGWMGVDAAGTVWVCTVGGAPGTWVQVGSGGGEGWPASSGTGPGNLTAETPSDDTVGYNFTPQGSGGFTVTDDGSGGIGLAENGTGGIVIETTGGGDTNGISITNQASDGTGISITDEGAGGLELETTGAGGLSVIASGALALQAAGTADNLRIDKAAGGSGDIIIEQDGSGAIQIIAEGAGDVSLTALTGEATLAGGTLATASAEAVALTASSSDITLTVSSGHIVMTGLPTSTPGGTGRLWNNSGVLSIT